MNGKNLLGSGIILGIVLMGMLLFFYGYQRTWSLWEIPPASTCFKDLGTVIYGAEKQRSGIDPYIPTAAQAHWTFNYPRIWTLLAVININQGQRVYYGIILAFLFFVSILFYIPTSISLVTAFILMISIFSPAVLLGVERGNTDLLMFFLLSTAIAWMGQERQGLKIGAVASVFLACVLKLFPIFSLGLVLRKRNSAKWGFFILISFLVYTLLTFDDLKYIRQFTSSLSYVDCTYGIDLGWLKAKYCHFIFFNQIKAMFYLTVLVCFATAPFWACRGEIYSVKNPSVSMDAFRVGSGIYIGTFLMGNSYVYRLVFLLFVIPQLMDWSKMCFNHVAIISKYIIVGILFSLWFLVISDGMAIVHMNNLAFFLEVFFQWFIFFGLFFLFFYTLPAWIREPCLEKTLMVVKNESI